MPDPLHIHIRGTQCSIDVKDGARLTAGRGPDCDIHVEAQSVCGYHLAMQRRGDEIEPTGVVALVKQTAGSHFDPAIAEVVVRLHERSELLPDGWES